MKILRTFVAAIAVAFISITPLRADAVLDGFKTDMASIEAYIKIQEAALKTNPMAGIAMIRGIVRRLQAVKTDGLPADLKLGYTEFVIAISKMGTLFEGWPEKSEEMQVFIVKKIGEDPKYMENFGKKMAAFEKDMQPATARLDELGRKYGLDMSKLSTGNAVAPAQSPRTPAPVMTRELMARMIKYTSGVEASSTAPARICKLFDLCDGTSDIPLRMAKSDSTDGLHYFALPAVADGKDILFLVTHGTVLEAYLTNRNGELRAAAVSENQVARLITNEKAIAKFNAEMSLFAKEAAEQLPAQ